FLGALVNALTRVL
uniref:Temporin-1Tt n=1 Tax=Rana temporaria TaxID=8407 RepID=TPT_RANTE|nr:RecName: Full=Temporin-1Tt; AltName: Full=Temporin-T [Rana temporaria]